MRKVKSVLYRIVFIIVFSLLAKSCVSDYIYEGDKDKIAERQQMLDENTFVIADLSNEYTETTLAKVVKMYKFNYTFTLNGRTYTDEISLSTLPSFPQLKLYYLKENPNIVSEDPQADIDTENKKGKSVTDLIVGIVWGILALLMVLSFFGGKKETEPKVVQEAKKPIATNTDVRSAEQKEQDRKAKEDPSRFLPK